MQPSVAHIMQRAWKKLIHKSAQSFCQHSYGLIDSRSSEVWLMRAWTTRKASLRHSWLPHKDPTTFLTSTTTTTISIHSIYDERQLLVSFSTIFFTFLNRFLHLEPTSSLTPTLRQTGARDTTRRRVSSPWYAFLSLSFIIYSTTVTLLVIKNGLCRRMEMTGA